MIWRALSIFFISLLAEGCAYDHEKPFYWTIGAVVPQHYDAWVEPLQLETSDIRTWRVPIGRVSCCWKEPWNTVGEDQTPPPNSVLVRWFSFPERKYYGRLVSLPANLEQRMRRTTPVVLGSGRIRHDPQRNIILGLAPGGQIVVWLMNQSRNAEEIMRVQAVELAANAADYDVWLTNYEAEHGDYMKQHGLQLDRW